jgi:hypothetical protein
MIHQSFTTAKRFAKDPMCQFPQETDVVEEILDRRGRAQGRCWASHASTSSGWYPDGPVLPLYTIVFDPSTI